MVGELMEDLAPLPHEWMIVSIIGFFVSWLFIYSEIGLGMQQPWAVKWGAAFMTFFIIMFIATIVNMSNTSLHEDHLEELAIHEKRKK